jgi:branched-chain amino acid transport system permease protein
MNTKTIATVATMAAAAVLPFVAGAYPVTVASRVLAVGVLAIAAHYLSATTRLASLGHGAYFGAGAYTTAWLIHAGTSLPAQISAAAVAGAITAAAAALGLVRLRGTTYVLASLAIGMIAATAAATATPLTGGTDGMTATAPALWPGTTPLANPGLKYLWLLTITTAVCALAAWHARSPFAAALIALGDNEVRARALGYPIGRILVRAHAFSGAAGGVSGAMWVYATGYLSPADLGLSTSVIALAAAAIADRHGILAVLAAATVLVVARDVAPTNLASAGSGTLWLGLVLVAAAFAPLIRRRTAR